MKNKTTSSFLSLYCFQIYLLIYIVLISSPCLGVHDHDQNKASFGKEKSNSITNLERSLVLPYQCEDKIDSQNYSANKPVGINEKNSVALNKFLKDVSKAQNNLKWIDHATFHIDHRHRLNTPLAHTNQYSTVSVNTGDVLERADIGYGSRLRGKRGFGRNYETTWMLEKKKYGRKSARNVPRRVYLNNDMTFEGNNADFDTLYQSGDMSDKIDYDRGTADRLLQDYTGQKNFYSSDRLNSNKNHEMINKNTRFHDYEPVREIFVNPELSENEKLNDDIDPQDQLIVSLYEPIRANNFTILRRSPITKNDKTRNISLSLESLKKTVLELKNNLMLDNKKKNIISKKESNGNEPKVMVEIYDPRENLDGYQNKEITRKLKRAQNIDDKNKNSDIFQEIKLRSYFGNQDSKKSHYRGKRSKTFIANLNNQNDTSNINKKAQIMKDNLKNVTQNTEKAIGKLYSDYFNGNESKLINNQQTINTSDLQYSLDKSFLSNYSNNFEKHKFIDLIYFSINNAINNSEKLLKNRNDEEKLRIVMQKISRLNEDNGQSKDAEKNFPQGNTSRGFGIATNELWSCETTVAMKEKGIAVDETQKQNREPIPSVIKVFEPRGHPYQKQKAGTTARLSWRTRKDGVFAVKMKKNKDEVDRSRNTNAKQDSSTSLVSVIDTTIKPEIVYINTSEIGKSIILKDLASITVDNNLRKQQQMVPFLSAKNRNANKSNGNLDTDRINIRIPRSNGNETMNVKEGAQTIMETHEYHNFDNNLQRKLLWISTNEEASSDARSVFNISENDAKNVINKNQQLNEITGSANLRRILAKVNRTHQIKKNHILQDTLNSQTSEVKHIRHKRSIHPYTNLESDNEDSENIIEKEAANNEERQENNEDYLNENIEGNYNDREKNRFEDDDTAVENEREQSSFRQQIDPARAKVNILIKQKLDKKHRDSNYRKKRHSTLNMIEYYDYDDEQEQERNAPINEQKIQNEDNKLSFNIKKRKRDDKKSYKPGKLGEKKNENAEAVMKEESKKAQIKNKEPKEEIIIDLGKRKNKTIHRNNKKQLSSLGSSFENIFNEEKQLSTKENSDSADTYQSKDFANNVYREKSDAASKWLDQPFENKMALSKNSELLLEDSHQKEHNLNKPLKYTINVDVNPDTVKDIMLDIQPMKIMEHSKDLKAAKDFYEDFEDEPSEDDFYYQDNYLNNIEPVYEELKNVYDWTNDELKSRPRLQGDQRLRYESDDTLDTNPSQLQPLNDKFLALNQNDNTRRFQPIDAFWMNNIFKKSLKQNSTEKNSINAFFDRTTTKSIVPIKRIPEHKNISLSPYESNKNVESKKQEIKRSVNMEKQTSINSQDLRESFVDSLDWLDDYDDNMKVRLGRGLKAVNETIISHLNKTYNQDNKLNATNANFKFPKVLLQTTHNNLLMPRNWYTNTVTDSYNIFNHHDIFNQSAKNVQESILIDTVNTNDEDLEVAEQKYVNNHIPRIKRTAVSYPILYRLNKNQQNFDEIDRSLSNQFHSPNILENQYENGVYNGYETGNWNSDIQDLDQYSIIPKINTKRRTKSGKKNKHFSEKRVKKSKSHSSNKNKKHHAHRFDISKNINQNSLKLKKKNKNRVQKSKMAERKLHRAMAEGKKVLYENVEDQSTVKPKEDDARRKEITLLLAADNNIDDESQIDMAFHGELARKIVEQISQQVQKNDQLKSIFGPELHRNLKTEELMTNNIYQQGLGKDETNHTETMIKKVMKLLDTLIVNEVQKKTCTSLSPDMREFLEWILEIDREKESLEEALPLPLVHEEIIPERNTGRKFLFDSTSKQEENIIDLQKKVEVLETLVKEYNALTAEEKTKVQTVHDYLIRQLNLLLRYIEARQTAETKKKSLFGSARAKSGNILQYEAAIPNATNEDYLMTKDTLPINYATSHHRKTRSLGKISSKQHRKMKRQKFRNQKQNKNLRESKRKHDKHHRELSSRYRKSRQKRAKSRKNDQSSPYYLGYEKPRIYDSFDLLDTNFNTKVKRKKKKRELADKENTAIKNNKMPDLLPIKGKNRMEDEVILLNKREAWKKKNKEQLEEIAFGKDMRKMKRSQKLMERDKSKPINETNSRMKREDIIRGASTGKDTNYSNKSHPKLSTVSKIHDGESWNNSKINNNNDIKNENKLELVERKINVFVDNKNITNFTSTRVNMSEKLMTNMETNNQVKEKLRAINQKITIDRADATTSFVNLTSDAKVRVSRERQKVSMPQKKADDNAVKLNRATNYQREETDPEIELKNLRQEQEKRIYDVTNWKMTDYFYDNDKLSRNKLKEKYTAKLDELGDLDTDSENNLELPRLRNNIWPNDVIEWKLMPIIKRSPYYDDNLLSRIHLIEKNIPESNNSKESQSNIYLNNPRIRQLKHDRTNSIFNISSMKISDNNFPHSIHRKQTSEIERLKDLQIDPTIIRKIRRLSQPRNNKRFKSMEFRMPIVLKDSNREYEIFRSYNHPKLSNRVIYDGVGLQLAVSPYQYYDDFADSSAFHFAPDLHGRDDIYPAYLEYNSFKKHHAHDANQQFVKRNRFRLGTSKGEDTVDFFKNNLLNKTSKS